ncbi:hypothetical protein [Methylomonas koyamae]|uniref:hypothetical protein n=1 Tax=Methylomonas koyamae TaxID=702114 RepID=UPI000A5F9312|nr:hypothetical protein [Methylomonas koyamae]ATG92122.1 hypothetical protein MKLM6_3947 [Methylomonas koyamae]
MKIVSGFWIVSLVAMIYSLLMVNNCLAQAQNDPQTSLAEESIRHFVQTWDGDKTTQYIAAFRDLNTDWTPEAIVYLTGSKWCGSGGCTTLILAKDGGSWKIVTKITISRPPIRVLSDVSHGWHNISVWVQGGSIKTGYDAELIFNGKTYPKNPTVPPARQLKEQSTGEVVIPLPNIEGRKADSER